MSRSWLYIMGLMFATSFISVWIGSVIVAVLLDLAVLAASYFILRNDMWVDLRSGMIFMTILTGISILDNLGLINHAMNWEALIALMAWSWFGAHSKIFQYFVIGSVIYNGVGIWQTYKVFQSLYVTDISTLVLSAAALLLVSYINR